MRTALIVLAALLPTACAHQRDEVHEVARHTHTAAEIERLPPAKAAPETATADALPAPMRRPDAAYERMSQYDSRPKPGGDVVVVDVDPRGGLPYEELFELIARETGLRIRYETHNAVVKSKKLQFKGPVRVPRDDLFAWFQDACFVDGLVAVPYGPADRGEVMVLDMANANLTSSPVFVDEDDLPALAGRSGLYVASVLTIPEGVDPARARQALSQHSTKTAGIGRINDIPDSGTVVVSDFAVVVATMRRALDEMAIARWEAAQR